MVKTVKLVLSILFGAALLLTQGITAADLAAPARCAAQKMSCCDGNKSCCKAKPVSESPQSPVLPAPGGSDTQLQAAMAPQCSILTLPNPVSAILPSHSASAIKTGPVSLYQRNCAYLI